ncbi:translocation/assembly module TamB domain-containing protein [Comamonas composti]|uniref:translocation/assembly module TamB domain-containing protein n=1 Tax=Comamonas composti TaxID=408558 RepID=UPI00047AEF11|nr:translocation/assembly module TamB domain-containing protein [Comamonas composti]
MVDSGLNTSATPDKQASAPAPRRRRWPRVLLWLLVTLILVLCALLGTAWWWSGQSDSLARTLHYASRWMPQGQSLQSRDVSGALRHGGRIGWLQWQNPSMKVTLQDAVLGWQLRPLLSRTLQVDEIRIAELIVTKEPSDEPDKPLEPLEQLPLPLQIHVPFDIGRIQWQEPAQAEVLGLQGRYDYDGQHHQLDVQHVQWADGSYQAQVQLQALAPMNLKAELQGDLQVQAPANQNQDKDKDKDKTATTSAAIPVQAKASVQGNLASAQAQLELQAHVSARPGSSDPMRADIQASVQPWQAQPLLSALAEFEQLDVAAFWAPGPRTGMSGKLQAGPLPPEPGHEEQAWQLQAELHNSLPGPWDQQRLPLDQLKTLVRYDGSRWQVENSRLDLGSGHILLQGHYEPATQQFAGQAEVDKLNPAALYSSLDAQLLQGRLQAESRAEQQVDFSVDLRSPGQGSKPGSLRIQTLSTQGQLDKKLLTLNKLDIEAWQASVHSRALQYDLEQQKLQTSLQAQVPGAKLALDGHISPTQGQGKTRLELGSLPALGQWLGQLPGIKNPLAGAQLAGQIHLDASWRGGWQGLMQRLQAAPGTAFSASGLQLNLDLEARQLRYLAADTAPEQALELPALRLNLQGSPEQARITLAGQARRGEQGVELDSALSAGLATGRQASAQDWQASLESLQAKLFVDKAHAWQLRLSSDKPVQLMQRSQKSSSTYTVSAGRLEITPPAPERDAGKAQQPAHLVWEDSRVAQSAGQWSLLSKGQAQGLPLAWVDSLALQAEEPLLASKGISGDLSFNAHWDLDTTGKDLKAELLVERAAGDLRLAMEDGSGTTVIQTSGPQARQPGQVRTRTIKGVGLRSRIKDARLQVKAQGSNVQATFNWESERAGILSADLRTSLARENGNWAWPDKAPLSGQIDAKMPDIGIWALFAPPGWRVAGSFEAKASISGDRQNPRWQGNLSADGLSIVSSLDGVDLHSGIMRARLQGNRLDLTELRLQGGRGSNTRITGYSGNLTSAPRDGGELVGSGFVRWDPPGADGQSSGLSMDMQAEAKALQVLVRADRQVSISGKLLARLEQGLFTLRGDLKTDRATIILPEESAPSLGSDVVVHSAASRKAEEEAARKQQQTDERNQAKAQTSKLPDILVKLDLGPDFALQGYGITTRLKGGLQVQGPSKLGGPPRITGEIRTEQGRYRAWGQALDVETGLIRFNGPYDNPSLDILALRPNITVRAGVQVQGSASAPRVSLYSEPEMPDAEKLSWVLMGRDPAAGGAESAMLQQAALSLLAGGGNGGNLGSSLGLDEVGFKGPGDGDASGAALTLGKRLSRDLYVTYEQSLSGAMGTLYIFYDLSRRLTLRGQTGTTSAVDLIYTVRKD